MTDGINEARREERVIVAAGAALFQLEDALDEVYDCVFGLPSWAIDDINAILSKYQLKVAPSGSADKP